VTQLCEARPRSIWRDIGHALKGTQHDYTAESLNRAILLLAVPMVLEMLMESLFALVAVFWVSRLGRDAVAVVGLTESVMTLIYAVAVGLSFAATAMVARRIGEKDPERAAQAAGQIIMLGLITSSALGLLFGIFAVELLELMGASRAVVLMGSDFARIMLGGNITVFMIFLINAIFRGAGDAFLAMRTLWLANAVNIALVPCFMYGWGPFPEMGVTGAAVATNIGRGVGLLYQLWHLAGRDSRVHVNLRHLRPALDILKNILTTAGNGIVQTTIMTTSWLGLFKILALFGSGALAGYTIAMRIAIFALMPAWGLANASATLVGQNLGAQKPDRAEAAVKRATRFNVILLSAVGIVFVVFAYPLVRLFTTDPEVVTYAARALWIMSLAFPFYAAGMCLQSAFNGAGDTWTPTRLNFFCLWLGQIPLAWLLAEALGLGPLGVFIAVPLASSALTLWGAVLFKRGAWKQQKV
jgi:putative MATE family efflux protein